MADYVATANALRTKLQEFTGLPIFWENGDTKPSPDTCPNGYVYAEVDTLSSQQITLGGLGNREFRDFGEFIVSVHVPRGSRAGTAEQHAQDIRALFQPPTLGEVVIGDRTIAKGREAGAVNGPLGTTWCVPVIIDWYADRKE